MRDVLLYDNIIDTSMQRGVDRYFREIATGVAQSFRDRSGLISMRRREVGMRRFPMVRLPRRVPKRAYDHQAAAFVRLIRPEVVLSAYFGRLEVPARMVFPLYDMIYERFPEHFSPTNRRIIRFVEEKRMCLERADMILAISHSTAADLVEIYPKIDRSRIRVTHLGVEESFFGAAPTGRSAMAGGNDPYLLHVGNQAGYKNFERLLEGFAQSGLARDFQLVAVSPTGESLTPHAKSLIAARGLRDRVRIRARVSDSELRSLYAAAVALVYPSEYEGFGLPILEAMASGTLVATSNRSSMPEVGGSAAFYFDPTSPDDIAARLVEIVALSDAERSLLQQAGIARAREFTWGRCRDQTNAAIRSLL